jgi:hypothetical protein
MIGPERANPDNPFEDPQMKPGSQRRPVWLSRREIVYASIVALLLLATAVICLRFEGTAVRSLYVLP